MPRHPFQDLLDATPLAHELIERSPDAIVLTDLEGQVLYVNQQVKSLLGYGADLIGQSVEALLPERLREAHVEHRRGYISSPVERPMGRGLDLKARHRNGAEVPVEISLSPLHTSAGMVVASIVRDIRELRAAEAEREQLIAGLEAKSTDLKTKNKELEQFTYTVSHDLKSPLVTIKGFLGFLRKDIEAGKSERIESDLQRIERATDSMYVLLEQLLELSRIGRLKAPPSEVPLIDLVNEVLEIFAEPIVTRCIEVILPDPEMKIYGQRPRLYGAVKNLIENAVKFTDLAKAPRIEIGGREEGDDQVVWVRDNGRGLGAEDHKRIFELFTRLCADVSGTGLGLAIVRRVAELHGGEAWVESEGEGQGAAFFLRLPSRQEAERAGDLDETGHDTGLA